MKEKLELSIYDEKGKVIKKAEANLVSIKFKSIRLLMDILNIEEMNSNMEMFRTLAGAWGEVKEILNQIFPDLTEEELDEADLADLLPLIKKVLAYSLVKIMDIPHDEKN